MAGTEKLVLVEYTTEPHQYEGFGLRFTKAAQEVAEYTDESSEAIGHGVALELIEDMEPRADSVKVLTGAVSLILLSGKPAMGGLQPLRPEPFMHGVVRGIEERRAWYSATGPQSPLC